MRIMDKLKEYKGMKFLECIPDKHDDKMPLLIYLHGAGERGDDVNKLTVHGPIKTVRNGMKLPFMIISPQCANEATWFDYGERLISLLEEYIKRNDVDENRVYITGNSMGGFGTWSVAMARPNLFAAIIPICGGGMSWNAWSLAGVPVWAFHCKNDPVVELFESEKMINALKKTNTKAEIKFTVYPYDHHDAWTDTYNNPETYEWLLSKTITGKEI